MSQAEPKDITAIEKAVNDTASRAGALWLTFISLAAYIIIAVGSVTHKKLLLETPLTLPLMNIELPLVGFFVVAPFFFILFHFYLLLQLQALAQKLRVYNLLLREQVSTLDRAYFRHRLDPFIFVQLLAGPRNRREGQTSVLIRLIAWISIVAIPILVFFWIELTFLPYHSERVTWLHRVMLLLDTALIWAFWQELMRDRKRRLPNSIFALSMVGVATLAIAVPVFPGETIYDFTHNPFTNLFFERVDAATGQSKSPFLNRLIVTDQKLIEDDRVPSGMADPKQAEDQKLSISISLRGRDLNEADLSNSDLRRTDFSGAQLRGARLVESNLNQARFNCLRAQIGCADLRGADLSYSHLTDARFENANLAGADFTASAVNGAFFYAAHLQGTHFLDAQTSGATFNGAEVDGAVFFNAHESTNLMADAFGTYWSEKASTDSNFVNREVLADNLAALFCDGTDRNSIYVTRGLIRSRILIQTGRFVSKIESASSKPTCKGAQRLTVADRAALKDRIEEVNAETAPRR